MVVGDLGLGRADDADQGGFAHIGEADQPHVGDQFQFQAHLKLLAGQAGLGEFGDLAGGGGEVGVAPAAPAALGHHHRLVAGNIRHHQAGVRLLHQGAPGHTDDKVGGVLATAAGRAAVLAGFGHILALVAEIHQGGEVVVGHKHHVAAPAAVAAVGAAGRHELLPVKTHRAVAALAGLDGDLGHIYKHGHVVLLYPADGWVIGRSAPLSVFPARARLKTALPGEEKAAGADPCGFANHYWRTLTFLRSRPMRSKLTLPSTRANRVSSLPLPTFSPG